MHPRGNYLKQCHGGVIGVETGTHMKEFVHLVLNVTFSKNKFMKFEGLILKGA